VMEPAPRSVKARALRASASRFATLTGRHRLAGAQQAFKAWWKHHLLITTDAILLDTRAARYAQEQVASSGATDRDFVRHIGAKLGSGGIPFRVEPFAGPVS